MNPQSELMVLPGLGQTEGRKGMGKSCSLGRIGSCRTLIIRISSQVREFPLHWTCVPHAPLPVVAVQAWLPWENETTAASTSSRPAMNISKNVRKDLKNEIRQMN